MPGHEDKMPFGNRPQRHLHSAFSERGRQDQNKRFCSAVTATRAAVAARAGPAACTRRVWALDFKNMLRSPGPWRMGIGGFGECLPNHNNYVEISTRNKPDAWGIPTLKINCSWMRKLKLVMSKGQFAMQAAEMLAAAGAKDISVNQEITPPGLAIHEMGNCADGPRSQDLCLNETQSGARSENLFMTDGACWCPLRA